MSECKFAVEAFHAYIESIGLSRPAGTLGELKAFKAGAEWQRSQEQAELAALKDSVTPDVARWLWHWMMDYCKRKGLSPAKCDDLFQAVGDMREMLAAAEQVARPMNNELLPCPFCGGEVSFHKDEECDGCHYIECQSCKGMFDLSMKTDPENSTETLEDLNERIAVVWNQRSQQSAAAMGSKGDE